MFKQRHPGPELIDAKDLPTQDLHRVLHELDIINNLLGGYTVSLRALKKLLRYGESYVMVDIGSGGGDTLKRILRWNRRAGHDLQLVGVDLKPDCIAYAENHDPQPEIKFLCDDYRRVYDHVPKIDVLHACLFCHHLTRAEIVELIRFAQAKGSVLLINDLERHPVAYASIKLLTRFFSQSYLVKNDASLSVLRGFRRREWIAILEEAGAQHFELHTRWAFRHQLIVYATKSNI